MSKKTAKAKHSQIPGLKTVLDLLFGRDKYPNGKPAEPDLSLSAEQEQGLYTLSLHAGQVPDPTTGSRTPSSSIQP